MRHASALRYLCQAGAQHFQQCAEFALFRSLDVFRLTTENSA
jgi:hypothetical protein